MIAPLTLSETWFEQWCQDHGVRCRHIREARAQGHKRPDYAIKVQQHSCIVEIKQLDPTPSDQAWQQDVLSGITQLHWIDPGARLRRPLRDAAAQLRKFSQRGFPTVVCFLDTTVAFHLERVHVEHAMRGQETLNFEVSGDPRHEPKFLGSRFGKKATLTRDHNTSISAVAVLQQASGSGLIIDLFHNSHAKVPISHHFSAPLVRKQYAAEIEDLDAQERSVLDLMQTAEWQEWLDDPDGKCEREVEKCLRELRGGKTS